MTMQTCRWFGQRLDFFVIVFNVFAMLGSVIAVSHAGFIFALNYLV